ncbi:telomerase RNA component interacting RNase-like [Paramormyrops kingsleyae]|uniref:telomerase RNA component interacting RNase-like n=1 Tax=Paramormyrops kingsleyae TaxID=1676925 RepID=UPI000CD61DB8|nr:telomerase RNA component interacting RNase-like [Paramormyrops kingsleyae]
MDAEGSPDSSTNRGESSDESSGSDSPTLPASPGQGIPKVPGANLYANDGSFLELFKKKMEEQEKMKRETEEGQSNKSSANEGQSTAEKKTFNVTNFVGKRRGGAKLALKTGVVAKKQKLDTEVDTGKGDAWTKYMAEVKKYKAHQCGDDDKTRPLVK